MAKLRASQTRIPPDAFSRVAYQGKRIRIERRGGKPVHLISEEDFQLLENLEDLTLAKAGLKALKEFQTSGKKAIPWAQTKAKLGL
jgi:hypothetical protein